MSLNPSQYDIRLAVYDVSRGQREGQEGDKVLAFFPPHATPNEQLSVVGLSQAVTSFADSFTSDEDDVSAGAAGRTGEMDTERHKWVMYKCEGSVWMVLVATKSWAGPSMTNATLWGALAAAHSTFALLHGYISQLLQQVRTPRRQPYIWAGHFTRVHPPSC